MILRVAQLGVRSVRDCPQHVPQLHEERARKGFGLLDQSDELFVGVYVISLWEKGGRDLSPLREMASEGRKQGLRRPGKGRECRLVELRAAQPNEVCPIPIGRWPQHRCSCA